MARNERHHPHSPHEDVNAQAGHFYRVARRGPGDQRLTTEPSSLDELRGDVRALLQDLYPSQFQLHPDAVTITGTSDGREVTITVQYFVAQPTDTWAPATSGPTADSSAWRHTVTQEAQKLSWHVRGPRSVSHRSCPAKSSSEKRPRCRMGASLTAPLEVAPDRVGAHLEANCHVLDILSGVDSMHDARAYIDRVGVNAHVLRPGSEGVPLSPSTPIS